MGVVAVASACVVALALVALTTARERRRRDRLRCALHELRRPLQALLLAHDDPGKDGLVRQLHRALAELERAIDGGAPVTPRRESLTLERIAADAANRWRHVDGVEIRVPAGSTRVEVDPVGFGSALDNLIANALEHGTTPVRVEAAATDRQARIVIRDSGPAAGPALHAGHDGGPRLRGNGLRIARATAAAHDGRLIEPQATYDGTLTGMTLGRSGKPATP